MIRRIFALLLVAWAFGFLWFAMSLPQPAGRDETDAIVVPTGSGGRIQRGLAMLQAGTAERMLVTGVDANVKPGEFAAEYDVPMELMECCVTLGFAAVDTRSNAAEAARWARERKVRTLRLVTTDWHMRRAASELDQALPDGVEVVRDAVSSEPSLGGLFLEYNKLIASRVARLWPD